MSLLVLVLSLITFGGVFDGFAYIKGVERQGKLLYNECGTKQKVNLFHLPIPDLQVQAPCQIILKGKRRFLR